jgi:hypothetical protein
MNPVPGPHLRRMTGSAHGGVDCESLTARKPQNLREATAGPHDGPDGRGSGTS